MVLIEQVFIKRFICPLDLFPVVIRKFYQPLWIMKLNERTVNVAL